MMLSSPVTDEESEHYVLGLFHTTAPGDAFVLDVSDCVMPDAKLDRVQLVGEMVRRCGTHTPFRWCSEPRCQLVTTRTVASVVVKQMC